MSRCPGAHGTVDVQGGGIRDVECGNIAGTGIVANGKHTAAGRFHVPALRRVTVPVSMIWLCPPEVSVPVMSSSAPAHGGNSIRNGGVARDRQRSSR